MGWVGGGLELSEYWRKIKGRKGQGSIIRTDSERKIEEEEEKKNRQTHRAE